MMSGTDLGQEAGGGSPPFTPERVLELKAKVRELFVQGREYSSAHNDLRIAMGAKPVWE